MPVGFVKYIRSDLREIQRSLDPALMMIDCGYDPDPWQFKVLRSSSSRLMLLCARQMGKSQMTSGRALHRAFYRANSLVLLISRSQDQADELFRKIMGLYDTMGRPNLKKALLSELELNNGSRIVALPNNEATIRGYSDCSLLIIDEASRVPGSLIVASMPMIMASSGDVIMLSTPCGPQGYFYQQWADRHSRWERIKAVASECPRFDPDVLADLRREMGPLAAQEFDCEFIQGGDQVFSLDSIDRAFDGDVPALQGF